MVFKMALLLVLEKRNVFLLFVFSVGKYFEVFEDMKLFSKNAFG